jgi:hypothetical protein
VTIRIFSDDTISSIAINWWLLEKNSYNSIALQLVFPFGQAPSDGNMFHAGATSPSNTAGLRNVKVPMEAGFILYHPMYLYQAPRFIEVLHFTLVVQELLRCLPILTAIFNLILMKPWLCSTISITIVVDSTLVGRSVLNSQIPSFSAILLKLY